MYIYIYIYINVYILLIKRFDNPSILQFSICNYVNMLRLRAMSLLPYLAHNENV